MKKLLLILALALPLAGQEITDGGGGGGAAGGGSGTVNTGADQDLVCYQGGGETVGPCSTAQILFDGANAIVGATTGAAAMKFGAAGTVGAPAWTFGGDLDTGCWRIGDDNFGCGVGGVSMVEFGGSQTMRVWDQTPTTGVTTLNIIKGAGQSADLFNIQYGASVNDKVYVDAAGSLKGRTNATGILYELVANFGETAQLRLGSTGMIVFNSVASLTSGTRDVGIARDSAGVLEVTDGSTGRGDLLAGDISSSGSISAGTGQFNLSRWNPPCFTLFDDASDLTATMDIPSLAVFMDDFGIQLDKVYCETDANTASINLQRDDGTPANVLSASLVCPTTGITSCADSGTEILTETDFATTANWDVTGDFAVGSGVATYTHSTGAGTLTQTEANQASAAAGDIFYRFDYTVASFTGDGDCDITTGFAASTTDLDIADGAQSTRFLAAANPGDFVISCTSTSGGFTLDDFALEAAPCVVDTISLAEDNFSKPDPTSNEFGDKMDLVIAAIDAGVRRVNVCVAGVKE